MSYCKRLLRAYCKYNLFKNVQTKSLSGSNGVNVLPQDCNKPDESIHDIISPDEVYNNLVERYLGQSGDHRCYIIHPYIKWGPKKIRDTAPVHQIEEAVALIRTLQTWKVVDTTTVSLDIIAKRTIFGSGTLAKLQKRIREDPSITAVFVNMGTLKNVQIEELEKIFGVPILDRYKIVMQILRLHATSKHAKLQVALAELPYLQARLKKHDSQFKTSDDFDTRKLMLKNREQKLKDAIKKLRSQRELLRNRRNKVDYPIVAVVGYTNSGKTSLIKALTNEAKLCPQDRLFATLDVTLHAGVLPSNLEVLYVDTVGFISDIPTGLIECFVATLEDAIFADVILHVEDLSSETIIHQRKHVLFTLQNLAQRIQAKDILDKIITVGNKLDVAVGNDTSGLAVSSKTREGIYLLRQKLEQEVIKRTGRLVLTIRVPSGADEIRWLYKNAAIAAATEDPEDSQYQNVRIVITEAKLHQFKHVFVK